MDEDVSATFKMEYHLLSKRITQIAEVPAHQNRSSEQMTERCDISFASSHVT